MGEVEGVGERGGHGGQCVLEEEGLCGLVGEFGCRHEEESPDHDVGQIGKIFGMDYLFGFGDRLYNVAFYK